MARLREILDYLDQELSPLGFPDNALNGLQIEGNCEVGVIATAVDSGLQVVESAAGADLLIVHHGLFWGKPISVQGNHKKIIQRLLEGNCGLYASHLPLDAHPRIGNNAQLAEVLGLVNREPCSPLEGCNIGTVGTNTISRNEILERLKSLEGSSGVVALEFGPVKPESEFALLQEREVLLCTAGESDRFDTLVTGEPRQNMYHYARENHLNIFCAGHYATETFGVRAVGEELVKRFGVAHRQIHCPTGI